MNHPPKRTLVAAIGGVLLALSASIASAAGLGKLSVSSSLGQPLTAEIELVSLLPGEFEALSARVASQDAYTDAKIEYSQQLRQLRFAVEKRADGKPVLKITSAGPITEPFLDVLVELSWPAGRLVREYPILLDPPGFDSARVTAPAVASVTPTKPDSAGGAVATPLPVASAPAPAPVGASAASSADTYGPVKRGDTLGKIAAEFKPDNVSMEQMLVALFRQNQDAFAGKNMNRLKTGQILRIPSADEVSKVAKTEAQREIRVQVEDWKSYRDNLAGAVAAAPAKAAGGKEVSGKITAPIPATPPPPAAADQLKIGKPDTAGKAGSPAGKAAAADAAKENKIAQDKAMAEAKSRIAELEKQAADAKKLIELKTAAAAKAEPAKAAPVPTPPVAAAPAKAGEPPKAGEAPKVAEAPKGEPPKGEAPKSDPKAAPATPPPQAAAKAPPKAPAKAPPPPPPEPSAMDMVMDNIVPIAGGTAGLLGIGGLFAWLRRRKKKSTGNSTGFSQTSSLMPSDMRPNSATGNKAGGLVDTGNSSFLTDFDKTGPGAIDTDEVDPVAEAEVYIAYGRDAQAEEILKEAMTRDRSRHEIAVKLLEIYHARKSAPAFETVARELRDSVGESSPLWAKAASMGASIDPTNSLYAGANSNYEATAAFAAGGTAIISAAAASAMSSAEAAKPDLDFDLGFDEPAPASSADTSSVLFDAPAAEPSPAAVEPAMDFDLNLEMGSEPALDVSAPAAAADSGGLDFDLAFESTTAPDIAFDAPAIPDTPAPAESEASTLDIGNFDFDLSSLSLDAPAPAAAPVAASAPSSGGFSLGDISLDLDGDGGSGGGAEDSGDAAAATKLELAKAYIEIGDSDGAKEILSEVAREGSAGQQAEAKKLLAEL